MGDPLSFWQRPRVRLYAVFATMWLIALTIFFVAARVLLPFELALLVAYVINPVISGIARRRIGGRLVPRWAAVLLVYAVLATFLWIFGITLVPQVYREVVRGLAELRDVLAGLGPENAREWAARI
ncbi:MAG: AI-2E family transporter, partial [Anaeromyxobacteraceae bacterium]